MSLLRTCISRVVQNSYTAIQKRVLPSVAISVRKSSDVPEIERPNVVKLRGLPYKTTKDEIVEFIGDENLIVDGKDGIFIGRGINSWTHGVALLKLKDEASVNKILKKDGDYIGKRYIDVILEREDELNIVKYENSITADITNMVKVSGVPFKTRKDEIENFFSGLEITPNGIIFGRSEVAKRYGLVYVQFSSEEDMKAAFEKDKGYIGDRYVRIEEANDEFFLSDTVHVPSQSTQLNSRRVTMKGLPWGVTKDEIEKFFAPLVTEMIYIETFHGRSTGKAEVIFSSEADAAESLKKHKHNIKHRFIELYSS